MPLSAFAALPDDARLWLVALDHPMEAAQLAPELTRLLGGWRHKGVQYTACWTLLQHQILAIAEPTLASQPSGCAIDGMLRGIRQVAATLGVGLLDPQVVLIQSPNGLVALQRDDLPAQLEAGTLGPQSTVLDLALLTLGDLRAGRLERPLASTWIGRKYKIQAPAATGA